MLTKYMCSLVVIWCTRFRAKTLGENICPLVFTDTVTERDTFILYKLLDKVKMSFYVP